MKQDAEVTAAPPAVLAEDPWMSQATRELARGLLSLRDEEEALRYLRDLCTVAEMEDLAERWQVARYLDEGLSYTDISRRTGASSATISRVNQWLRYGRGGYRLVLDRLARTRSKRRT
ncbi:MAG: YerC/YecD family TrpR-related protein [Candidatus Limnocylindrales bacterium]